MAFELQTTMACHSGGEDDFDLLTLSVFTAVSTSVSRSTAYPQTGAGCVAFDLSTNANVAFVPLLGSSVFGANAVVAVSFAIGVSATPTSAAGVIRHVTNANVNTAGGFHYIRVTTDLKIGIYDKNDTLLAKSSTSVPSGASGTPQEFCVVFDSLTLPSVFVTIYAGDAVDTAFDTGLSRAAMFDQTGAPLYLGEYLGAYNRGCIMYIDDARATYSTSASDAVHTTAFPRVRISEPRNSTTIGNYNAWDSQTNSTIDNVFTDPTYIDNGELPTHDGDTSNLQSTVQEAFTVKSTDANPVTAGATIIAVEQRLVGRFTGAGKLAPFYRYRLSATDSDANTPTSYGTPSTAYVGMGTSNMTRPGGGSWAQADFAASTLEWGLINPVTDGGFRVTLMQGPAVAFYTDTLPLGTRPQVMDDDVVARGVGMGVMAGVG